MSDRKVAESLSDVLATILAMKFQPDLEQAFDWRTFVCSACGETISVGRSPEQSLEDFWVMCELIFGDPPVCSPCRQDSG